MKDQLDRILAEGNRPAFSPAATYSERQAGVPSNNITCVDGFKLSVVAGAGAYCTPRVALDEQLVGGEVAPDFSGPYTAVEVGFPSERPEPWSEWSKWCEEASAPTDTVYAFVPAEAVRALVDAHGGVA